VTPQRPSRSPTTTTPADAAHGAGAPSRGRLPSPHTPSCGTGETGHDEHTGDGGRAGAARRPAAGEVGGAIGIAVVEAPTVGAGAAAAVDVSGSVVVVDAAVAGAAEVVVDSPSGSETGDAAPGTLASLEGKGGHPVPSVGALVGATDDAGVVTGAAVSGSAVAGVVAVGAPVVDAVGALVGVATGVAQSPAGMGFGA
jgi:hypothetical protein